MHTLVVKLIQPYLANMCVISSYKELFSFGKYHTSFQFKFIESFKKHSVRTFQNF